MSWNAQVLVLGAITGCSYGILALGIVMVYRSSKVINFSQGDLAALAGGLMPWLVAGYEVNYWLAALLALVAAIAAGALFERLVIRPLRNASRIVRTVATIGAAQAYFVLSLFIPLARNFKTGSFPIPVNVTWYIGSVRLTGAELPTLVGTPLVCLGLVLFFRNTAIGLASRAAVDNEESAALSGISLTRISIVTWSIAGLLAGIAGILSGPLQPVVQRTQVGPELVERALAAAMIGGMTSFAGALVGGIVVGLVEALLLFNSVGAGTVDVGLLVLIVGVLAVRRQDVLLRRAGGSLSETLTVGGVLPRLPPDLRRSNPRRVVDGSGLAVLTAAVLWAGMGLRLSFVDDLSIGFVFAIMGLSLVVITGYCGQISAGQSALVAIGAVVGGRLVQLHLNWAEALLCVVAIGLLFALIVGVPALRVRGDYLAIVTLAVATAAASWLFAQSWLAHVNALGETSLMLPRPSFAGVSFQGERAYFFLTLAFLLVSALAVLAVRRSSLGRAMVAVRENEMVAEAQGIPARRIKLAAFAISGAIAALGGYLYGGLLVSFSDPSIFDPSISLLLISLVIIGGVSSAGGALLAALLIEGIGNIVSQQLPGLFGSRLTDILGGFGLLLVLVQNPDGMISQLMRQRIWLIKRLHRHPSTERNAFVTDPSALTVEPVVGLESMNAWLNLGSLREVVNHNDGVIAPAALEVSDIEVVFGAQHVLKRVSLSAKAGSVVGLVGPNGAGKSTLFDVIGGQLRHRSGKILLNGADITRKRPDQRARLGLGRSFQHAKLYPALTVGEILQLSAERGAHSNHGLDRRAQVESVIAALNLSAIVGREITYLSSGTRRIVELASLAAQGSQVILLDEPTAGLAQREVEAFPAVIEGLRVSLGATIIVIEHDFPTIAKMCDTLYLLLSGEVCVSGPPDALRSDSRLIEGYLGTDEAAIGRSN